MTLFDLKNSKLGMTLIEMVISLVILSILMTSTMGMIISSNNIFISTTTAALDRQVGNYAYNLIEKLLKYSTHMTIQDEPDPNNSSKSLSISVTDENTNSGKLLLSGTKLYEDSFYGNRTVQYSITSINDSKKHLQLTVNVYRNSKLVYTKTSVLKCINLDRIKSGDATNPLRDNSTKQYNQYLYFSIDEIPGGSEAWSLEMKVKNYVDKYNEILKEYYDKLIIIEQEYDSVIDSHKEQQGNRISSNAYQLAEDNRDAAIFGTSSNNIVKFEGNYADANGNRQWNNIKEHYSDEVTKLLKFTPSGAYSKDTITINKNGVSRTVENPYYNVVATKEELYAGFLFTYYGQKNGDNYTVKLEDFPAFSETDSFFNDTIFKTYINKNNRMMLLTYFKDGLNENYNSLFTIPDKNAYIINTFKSLSAGVAMRMIDDKMEYISKEIRDYDESSGTYTDNQINYYSFREFDGTGRITSEHVYKFNDGGTSLRGGITVTESKKSDQSSWGTLKDGWYTYDDALDKFVELTGAKNISSYASVNLDAKSKEGNTYHITMTATKEIPEGWYYLKTTTHASNIYDGYHVFYLEAAKKMVTITETGNGKYSIEPTEKDNTMSTVMMPSSNGSEAGTVEFSLENNSIRVANDKAAKNRGYRYTQVQYEESDSNSASLEQKPVCKYVINQHKFSDWIMYGVDENSWFNQSEDGNGGLFNTVITNTASFINRILTGNQKQLKVEMISTNSNDKSTSPMLSLGLTGQTTIDKIDGDLRSYETAFLIYHADRGTWYYLPTGTTKLSASLSNMKLLSHNDYPTPIDLSSYTSSDLKDDINKRKIKAKVFLGLSSTDYDALWVALPVETGILPTK